MIDKTFWISWLKAENLQKKSQNRSEQFWKQNTISSSSQSTFLFQSVLAHISLSRLNFWDCPPYLENILNVVMHYYGLFELNHVIILLIIRVFFSMKILVFCYQNCSDLLWEKIVLLIEKNFWNSRLKVENLQNFWDH